MNSMQWGLPIAALALAACSFNGGVPFASAGDTSDADVSIADADPFAPDADPNVPDADLNVPDAQCDPGSGTHFDACAIPVAAGPLVIGADTVYDTDIPGFTTNPNSLPNPPSMTLTQTGQNAILISVTSFEIASGITLRVVGDLPLVVASAGAINIDGRLDLASRTGDLGAGYDSSLCSSNAAQPGLDDGGGASGGGGGGFGSGGGDGGEGDSNGQSSAGGEGGSALADPPLVVRGGCRGAIGGNADGLARAPGSGGGAIQLTSQTSLRISGVVNAGGGGGLASNYASRAGGSGGGSGGYIGLDAPSVVIQNGTCAANGGGGGEGAALGGDGTPEDGEFARANDQPAQGGNAGPAQGGDGGDGGAKNSPDGAVGDGSNGGGGGGGGGVGYLLIWTSDFTEIGTNTLSPDPELI